ncbi:MAG: sigma-54-dependent Fis family transcriptional regulator [Candidatus Latescibacterota bacterium]|nr:MAG: sigma-54-dependent Fis family transcriptional regulator [Candidatus Latescibacterota bacterium]
MEFAIHIIESSDFERQNIRDFTKKLAHPVRIVEPPELDKGRPTIDIVILGLSTDEDVEPARAQLSRIRSLCPTAQIVLCTPSDTEALDSTIMSFGARSFLLKPIEEKTFVTLLNKMLSQMHRRKQREKYVKGSRKTSRISDVIGKSEAIRHVLALVERVAKSPSTSVLLLGESGTGKSLFAQTVHEQSDRASGPFIEINCAAMPSNLLESELFGYEPGAFTDAKAQKIGLIELADRGTLLLDEITETDTQTQAKLLKFLDSKKLRRLGGDQEITVDVRIIAATNRDLREEVKEKRFRDDLFYRLNVVEIRIPPLRDRKEDIDMIATYYLGYYKKKFRKPYLHFTPDVQALLRDYPWPGNVRELINVIERAVLLGKDATIKKVDLPIEKKPDPHVISFSTQYDDFVVNLPPGGISLDMIEKKVIEATLVQTGGNVLKASRLLGMSRGALRYKLAKHKIEPQTLVRKKLVPAT